MVAVLIISRLLLAIVFAVAGIAKLSDLGGTRKTLADFGVPEFLARGAALLLPLFELSCAAALIPSISAWWGAAGVLGKCPSGPITRSGAPVTIPDDR